MPVLLTTKTSCILEVNCTKQN